MAHLSVAVALVMMTMMVSCSNCVTSNKSIGSITSTGNSTAAASSTWCNGNIVDGQCMLVADASYGGGEHSDLNLNVTDLEVLEYYDLDESSIRVLLGGVTAKPGAARSRLLGGVTAKPGAARALDPSNPSFDARNQLRYVRQHCGLWTRGGECSSK